VASGWRLYTLANFEESEQRGWWLAAGVSTLLPTLRRASSEQRGGWLAASWCLAGGWELAAGWWLAADVSTLLPTLRGASSEQRGWRRAVGGGRLAAGGWWLAAGWLLATQLPTSQGMGGRAWLPITLARSSTPNISREAGRVRERLIANAGGWQLAAPLQTSREKSEEECVAGG
jgi:hypothetical protein